MAASISYPITLHTLKSNKLKLQCLKVNGVAQNLQQRQEQVHDNLRSFHQKNQTKKQLADPCRQANAMIVGDVYRQTFVVRSYEIGPDGRATVETMLYLLQEIGANHMLLAGFSGLGRAIWVTTRLQLQVEQYFPLWREVVEIDTWFGPFGKSGLRRNSVIRSQATGCVLARAISIWLMLDRKTRRHSNIPDELRDEVSPWFAKEQTIQKESHEKIDKLDINDARYVYSDIKVKRCDMDMNHHVNNVKYVSWMLEPIPEEFLKNYQLCNIALEYRGECRSSDLVQSLCKPQEDGLQNQGLCSFTHQVQIKGEIENQEALRGKTTWKLKNLAS